MNTVIADRFNKSILATALVLTGSLPAWGNDYFDPGLLTLTGEQGITTDLSIFETSGQIPEGDYLVSLWVNQVEHGQQTLVFKKNAAGKIRPELTPAFLKKMGVNTEALPDFKDLPVDQPIDTLEKLIPNAQINFDSAQLRLDLSIPQIAMQQQARDLVSPDLWDSGVPALLVSYNLNGNRNWQHGVGNGSGSEQTSLFADARLGVNWQEWRLRGNFVHTRNESRGKQMTSSSQYSRFFNTSLQRDIVRLRAEILLGESSSGNEIFDSIPFRGMQLRSSEAMLPNSRKGFAPLITGIAQSNARVTVSQNGNVVYQTYVPPGAFRIDDMYQASQGGDLLVTITESDGTVRTQSVAYSALPMMQRPGTLKYELTAGRYHGGVTDTSKEAEFGLATFLYGLPFDTTLYGGVLGAKNYNAVVAGSGISLGSFGALSADITRSSALLSAREQRQMGTSYRLRYAKSLLSTGTSVDLAAYRYSTRHYYSFADFNNMGHRLHGDQMPWALDRQRSNLQLQINQQLGKAGALYLSASRNDYWGNNRINKTLSAGYNVSYRGISYGLAYSIDRMGGGEGNWPENKQLAFNMQVPLGIFGPSSSLNRQYASYQMTHGNQGQMQQQAGISGNALDDRFTYSLMQGWSNNQSSDNSTINTSYQGSKGMASAGYTYNRRYRSINIGGNGSLVVHPEGVTFGQTLGDSVAIVSAPGAGGVRVANGGIRTDGRGYALVPYLANYQSNNISLDLTTLPENVDLPQSGTNVYPTRGAVVMAHFSPRIGYQALLTLKTSKGAIPFGTVVTLEHTPDGEKNTGIVGDAGQVYLSGLPEKGTLFARWGHQSDQQCRANFNLENVKATTSDNPVRQLTSLCKLL